MSWRRRSHHEIPQDIYYCRDTGKPSYDKRGAQTAANKRWNQEHVQLRIYQCGPHWHLTKQLKNTDL